MGIWLVMLTESGERPFPIRKPKTIIGREVASDLRIAVPSVAARHCELTLRDDELKLVDLGSDRGTLHNGQPVNEAVLSDTDELTVGPVTFHVRRTRDGERVTEGRFGEPSPGPGEPDAERPPEPRAGAWSEPKVDLEGPARTPPELSD